MRGIGVAFLHGATSNSPRRKREQQISKFVAEEAISSVDTDCDSLITFLKEGPVSGLGELEDASNDKQTCVEGEDCRRDGKLMRSVAEKKMSGGGILLLQPLII